MLEYTGGSTACQVRGGRFFRLARSAVHISATRTGASDDDPSGIGTYSQAGAQFGFSIGWTMLLTYPLMVAIQEISAHLGRTTGMALPATSAGTSRTGCCKSS
jgi:hypothetical protein